MSTTDILQPRDAVVSAAPERRSLRAWIADIVSAAGTGLRAAHHYERLTARGVAPDSAVRVVFEEHFAQR